MVFVSRAWKLLVGLILGIACLGTSQVIKTKNHAVKADDPSPANVVAIVGSFTAKAGIAPQNGPTLNLTSEMSHMHGEKRPMWTVRSPSKLTIYIDMKTRSIVSFMDFGREEAQFKGLQPRRKPLIQTRADARRRVEIMARKLGIPSNCKPDSFDFKQNPGDLPKSAGRAGMTFANPSGVRVGGLSIDLLDGGINGYWFAPWKVKQNARKVPTG